MNLHTKQKWPDGHRKQIYGYQKDEGRNKGQIGSVGLTYMNYYT